MNAAHRKQIEELRIKAFLSEPSTADMNTRFGKLRTELTDLLGRSVWDQNDRENILIEIDIKCIRLAKVCRMLLGQE